MKWLIKNAFSALLLFPCNFLLVMAAAWLVRERRPRLAKGLAAAGFAGLVIFSMPAISVLWIDRIERESPPLNLRDPALATRADAIVVLGAGRTMAAMEYGRDVTSPNGFLRLRYGAELQRRTSKPILLSGGEPDFPGTPEAVLMNEALKDSLGTQAKWLEDKSVNTAENAEFSYRILAPLGVRRIFLVTNASHMPRARRSFAKAGFEVVPAPMGYFSDKTSPLSPLSWIPNPEGAEMSYICFHEVIGSFWYALTGG
jgi:uncharacterized SAM-binding protein YcdF (DUF218 family)